MSIVHCPANRHEVSSVVRAVTHHSLVILRKACNYLCLSRVPMEVNLLRERRGRHLSPSMIVQMLNQDRLTLNFSTVQLMKCVGLGSWLCMCSLQFPWGQDGPQMNGVIVPIEGEFWVSVLSYNEADGPMFVLGHLTASTAFDAHAI